VHTKKKTKSRPSVQSTWMHWFFYWCSNSEALFG